MSVLPSASGPLTARFPASSVDGEAGLSNQPHLAEVALATCTLLRGENTFHIFFQLSCEQCFSLENESTWFGRWSSVDKMLAVNNPQFDLF